MPRVLSNRKTNRVGLLWGLGVAALLVAPSAHAAPGVNLDPVRFTGPAAIDPTAPDPTAGALDASGLVTGAATKAALTGAAGFGVVQTWTGFTNNQDLGGVGQALNFIDFTDVNLPDVSFATRSFNLSGGGFSVNFTTSSPNNQYLGSGGHPQGVASKIDFGTLTAGEFVADKLVDAVGFMVSRSNQAGARTFTVNFRNFKEEILSTQSVATTSAVGSAWLFGYVSPGASRDQAVASIELLNTGGDVNSFMDDFGFNSSIYIRPATLPGDVNFDGLVDTLDFDTILANFRTNQLLRTGGDLTGQAGVRDGFVDLYDFDEWKRFATPAALAAVSGSLSSIPEPSALFLLAIGAGAVGFAARQRR
jgi:hypothetical protein